MRGLLMAFLLAGAMPVSAAPLTHRVSSQIPLGDGGWDLLSVSSADRRIYIAHGDRVSVVDLLTGKATDTLIAGHRIHAALAIPGTHEVILTNGETNTATLFDGRTGVARATVPTGTKPDAAAFDPATETVWVMNAGSGDITVIDPKSAKVLTTVAVGGSLELGVADGKGLLFVNVEDRNDVAVLNTRTHKLVKRFPLAACEGPTGIAYEPAFKEVVSACGDNAVAVVSSPDGKQIARLPIGRGADGAAVDARRHLALVPGGRDGILTVIKLGAKPAVIERVATAPSARTIAIDEATGRSYLPAANYPPAVGKERPKAVPGSARLLVVTP